jgi:YL1 nuclear protein C-terminal domain
MTGVSQKAQRKAWNEAMRTAAAAALPASLQTKLSARRSDRRKLARREKARKVTVMGDEEFRAAVWLDALEEVDTSAAVDDEEEYDELDELDGKRARRKTVTTKAGVLPKRFKARSFASILLEESGRDDGISTAFLNSEAKISEPFPPRRKFCPVTGQLGIYTDPKSGVQFANLKALDQIRERAPPWMTLGGTAAFHEAIKSLRHEE